MRGAVYWIAAIASVPLAAQTASFEAGVTNVHLDVSVVFQGKSVLRLTKDDFVVRDEGQVRPILSFDENTLPLDLVFVLDTGWQDAANPDKKKNSHDVASIAATALHQMRPFDRTAVISFALDPHVEQELTSDARRVATAIERTPHNSSVILSQRFLALRWAAWLLGADLQASQGAGSNAGPAKRKRAVFVVTSNYIPRSDDEQDEPLIEQYWESDIALSAVLFNADPRWDVNRRPRWADVGHVAQATGGEAVSGASKEEPEKQIPDLLVRLQSSYTLFYAPPTAKSGETRHITIELSEEAKKKYPGAVVNAREGYIAK